MFRIYLTNLGKYNEGELVGKWVDLPCDDFAAELAKIGVSNEPDESGRYYEEYFITDYESDVHGLRVGEYDNLDELNDLAEAIEENETAAAVLIKQGYTTADEIREHIDDVAYICEAGFNSDYELGYYYATECGYLDKIPEDLRDYFDFESFGRDIRLNGNFTEIDGSIYELCA